jgi:parvulin-like peptidyl-prolyl isomerase
MEEYELMKKRLLMRVFRYLTIIIVVTAVCGISLAALKEIAKVDDFVVTDSYFKQRLNLVPAFARNQALKDKEKFLDRLINEELFILEAKKMNLHDSEEYKLKTETYGRELLADMYMRKYLQEKNTEDNQRKYYEENKKNYERQEMVRISVIRTKTEEEAKEVLKKANSGEDFAKLVEKYSSGPAADKGGDFGFRDRKTLRKEYGDIAFSMKKGEVKGPIKLSDGYHIIKLTDYREGGIAPFEDVKKRVTNEYSMKLMEEKTKELKKAHMIHIDEAELKNLKVD